MDYDQLVWLIGKPLEKTEINEVKKTEDHEKF